MHMLETPMKKGSIQAHLRGNNLGGGWLCGGCVVVRCGVIVALHPKREFVAVV
jgi:hypothetical protein